MRVVAETDRASSLNVDFVQPAVLSDEKHISDSEIGPNVCTNRCISNLDLIATEKVSIDGVRQREWRWCPSSGLVFSGVKYDESICVLR